MTMVTLIQLGISDSEGRRERFSRVEAYLELQGKNRRLPDLVVLPEIWATGFFNFHLYAEESEPLQGETYSRLAPWAEQFGCYILAGSIVERDNDDLYNTALLIGPTGALEGSYRKIHLYGYKSEEKRILTPGSNLFSIETRHGKWGFSTCYDLRFPELYRKLVDAGVEVLFNVAAWPLQRIDHWLLLSRARALENLCYMVSCNCAGNIGGHSLGGNSVIVDPWGEVVARAGLAEQLLSAELGSAKAAAVRAEFPALADRRMF